QQESIHPRAREEQRPKHGDGWASDHSSSLILLVSETHHLNGAAGSHRVTGIAGARRRRVESEEGDPSLGEVAYPWAARVAAVLHSTVLRAIPIVRAEIANGVKILRPIGGVVFGQMTQAAHRREMVLNRVRAHRRRGPALRWAARANIVGVELRNLSRRP